MGFRYPQPDNEDAFEQMCLRFYRKHWKNENLLLYAKRGEKQDGVDIHDPACLKPVRAVQCKHHEPTKTLPPAEIKEEVRKAEESTLPIEQYVIVTTAKKSKNAHNTAVELNRRAIQESEALVILNRLIGIADDSEDLVGIGPNDRLPFRNWYTAISRKGSEINLIVQPRRCNGFRSRGRFIQFRSQSMPGGFPSIHHGRPAVGRCKFVCH